MPLGVLRNKKVMNAISTKSFWAKNL